MGSSRPRNSTRHRVKRARSGKSKLRRKPPDLPELHLILYRLHDALALVTVAHVALSESDATDELVGQAGIVLRQGITALNAAYNELDAADIQISRNKP